MSAMKRVVILLVLLALGANVSLGLECEHLNKTLAAKDLNQVGLGSITISFIGIYLTY